MTPAEVHAFAHRLMDEVWRPFDASRLEDFYHRDVVGHHRSQVLEFSDIENRLAWDRRHWARPDYRMADLIAEGDRFSLRFVFQADESAGQKRPEIEVIYFYHLREGKIAEFWLLASVDFDYRERP
jgi:predicted ester cyclase